MQFSLDVSYDTEKPRIPLSDAVRRYWKHLVPVVLLPTVVFSLVGFTRQMWAFWAVVPLFYGCSFYAMRPCTKKDAPYSFWLVACGVSLLGVIPAVLVFAGLEAILHR
jgi:hypothetical protein